jgi:hypothetical protein
MQEPPLDKFGMNMYCNTFLNLFYEIYHHQLVPQHKRRERILCLCPYVREMNVWGNYVKRDLLVAPMWQQDKTAIDCAYNHPSIKFIALLI